MYGRKSPWLKRCVCEALRVGTRRRVGRWKTSTVRSWRQKHARLLAPCIVVVGWRWKPAPRCRWTSPAMRPRRQSFACTPRARPWSPRWTRPARMSLLKYVDYHSCLKLRIDFWNVLLSEDDIQTCAVDDDFVINLRCFLRYNKGARNGVDQRRWFHGFLLCS